MKIEDLKFNEKGLIPVVMVNYFTGDVLTLAYANMEALKKTLETGYAHFWSRSRNKLWKKGEKSGNVQRIVAIRVDCDEDSLIYEVIPSGPSCHTGNKTCFYRDLYRKESEPPGYNFLTVLEDLLISRKKELPEGSYTAELFKKGKGAITAKILEEAQEFVESLDGKRDEIVWEGADLLFFLLLGCVYAEVPFSEIIDHLRSRFGR